jgi:hypothetical protein
LRRGRRHFAVDSSIERNNDKPNLVATGVSDHVIGTKGFIIGHRVIIAF